MWVSYFNEDPKLQMLEEMYNKFKEGEGVEVEFRLLLRFEKVLLLCLNSLLLYRSVYLLSFPRAMYLLASPLFNSHNYSFVPYHFSYPWLVDSYLCNLYIHAGINVAVQ
jgi:hypothetical protein